LLALCVSLLPVLLAVVPHAAAALLGVAGLCAGGLLLARQPRFAVLRLPGALLFALLLWGGISITWSIDPARSLVMLVRLAGIFAAALALVAAVPLIPARRIAVCILGGTAIAILLALYDLGTAGGLEHLVSARSFFPPHLNQIAAWLALMVLPTAAYFAGTRRSGVAATIAVVMAAAVLLLADTTAKFGLALAVPVAVMLYRWRSVVCRIGAAVLVAFVVTAPLTLPALGRLPALFSTVDALKGSAGHRLLIWSFVGDHIAERPLVGWGLDSSRAIPGGKELIRPGQPWLPLHPHDAALQLWLELGAPGAVLLALIFALLWLRLAAVPWPPLYAAAAGGSLSVATVIVLAGWGIWEEWWLATLAFVVFATMTMEPRLAEGLLRATLPVQRAWRGDDR
jgi:O-antigen ligase